jgi:hypothetical protein
MQNTLKIAIASALLLLFSSSFLFLGGRALTSGVVYFSRYQITTIHQDQSPLFFYTYVAFMMFFGVLLLAAGVAVWFSRGEIREEAISFVDSAILSRPSPRWSLIVLAIVAVSILVGIVLFGL